MGNSTENYKQNLVHPTIQKLNWEYENYNRVREWTLQKTALDMIYLIDVQQSIQKHICVQDWYDIYNAFIILWKQLQKLGHEKRFEDLWDGILDKHRQGVLSVYLISQLEQELPETLLKKLKKSGTQHLQSEKVEDDHFEKIYALLLENPQQHAWEQLLFMPAASARSAPFSAAGPAASARPAPERAGGYFVPEQDDDDPPEFQNADEYFGNSINTIHNSAGGLPLFQEDYFVLEPLRIEYDELGNEV